MPYSIKLLWASRRYNPVRPENDLATARPMKDELGAEISPMCGLGHMSGVYNTLISGNAGAGDTSWEVQHRSIGSLGVYLRVVRDFGYIWVSFSEGSTR